MRLAYFDCFAGVSGEMLLAALIAAGLPLDSLKQTVSTLHLDGYTLDLQRVVRNELSGLYLSVLEKPAGRGAKLQQISHSHRNAAEQSVPLLCSADQVIGDSDLPDVIKQTSLAIFKRLDKATAAIAPRLDNTSSCSYSTADIVTVVGIVAGLALMSICRVECSPIHIGSGVIYSAEGIKPALSPVAAEILRTSSVPIYGSSVSGELVTPVGAAVITTVASAFGAVPAMKIEAVGYGAGKYDLKETPNLVRLFVGACAAQVARSVESKTGGPNDGPHDTGSSHIGTSQPSRLETSGHAVPSGKAFISSPEEWAALVVKGHQHSGRQRLAS